MSLMAHLYGPAARCKPKVMIWRGWSCASVSGPMMAHGFLAVALQSFLVTCVRILRERRGGLSEDALLSALSTAAIRSWFREVTGIDLTEDFFALTPRKTLAACRMPLTGSRVARTQQRRRFEGRNTETVLWFQTKEGADTIFDGGPFKLKKIVPDKFVAGKEQEPRNDNTPPSSLALHAALLGTQGTLDCQADRLEDVRNVSLRLRNFNEPAPFLSLRSSLMPRGSHPLPLTRARWPNSAEPPSAN